MHVSKQAINRTQTGQSHWELRSTQLPRHTREGGYPGGEQWGNRPLDTRLRGYDDNWDEASVSNAIALSVSDWLLTVPRHPGTRPSRDAVMQSVRRVTWQRQLLGVV